MKGVIYARYSSDKQTEQSIEGQIRECKKFAEENEIEIIKIYTDRAISGKTADREEFQEMISDSANGEFKAVVVYKLDRFARNRYDSAIYKSKLKSNSVKVLSAKENITDSPEGVILESLLEGMAEYYSLDLAQKTSRGMMENALKCRHTGGRPLLGYKLNPDKTYCIDESAATIVRKIFELYAQGSSYNQIIDILNKTGAKTGSGKTFGKNSIHDLLRNERYTGVYIYNRIPRDSTGKRNSHGTKEDGMIRIEGGMPAIIDRELWEEVQKKMEGNKKSPARNKAKIDYLLSGKLFCGHCGSAMVGQSSTTRGVVYPYYVCNHKVRLRTCDKKNVKKDEIEDLVIHETIHRVLEDDAINNIADQVAELSYREGLDTSRLDNLKLQLKSTEEIITNICNAIAQGVLTPSTKKMLEEAEEKKERLILELEQEKVIQKNIVTKEQVLFWLSQFQGGDINNPEYRKRLVDVFINKVFIYDDKIVITYNFSGDNNTVELSDINSALSDLSQSGPPAPQKPKIFIIKNIFGFVKGLIER